MQSSSHLHNLFQTFNPFDPGEDQNDDGVWVEVCSKTTKLRRRRKSVNWKDLPRDVMIIIFAKLELEEMLTSVPLVCQLWRNISKQPGTIRRLDLHNYRGDLYVKNILKFVTKAVHRSCGELTEFRADRHVSDEIVDYIVSNTKMLKVLGFSCWSYTTRRGLVSAVRKAPFVEELELFGGDCNKEMAEEIVRSCPLLKCLRINSKGNNRYYYDDEDENEFDETSLGLEIVIEGCLHLECLDLEKCVGVDLNQDSLMECEDRIRILPPLRDANDNSCYDDYYDRYYFNYGFSPYYDPSSSSSDDEEGDHKITDLLPPKATAYYL